MRTQFIFIFIRYNIIMIHSQRSLKNNLDKITDN